MITCRNSRSGPMVPEDCPATSPVGIREEVHTPALLVYGDGGRSRETLVLQDKMENRLDQIT